MTPPRRWIRLDVSWSGSEWIANLPPASRLAWVELLTYVKTEGVAGTVKSLSVVVFGRRYGIEAADVQAMLDAAVEDGALVVGEKAWTVSNWSEYQETDSTARERMRRYRAERSAHSPLRRNNRNDPQQAVTDRDERRNPSRDRDRDRDRSKGTDVPSSDSPAAKSDPRVAEVFAYWLERTGRDPSRTKLTKTRRQKIQARLRRFTPEDLLHAIDGVMLSDHHRKKPEWTDLVSCFGNDEKVEAHIERWRQRGRNGASAPPPAGRKQQLREALEMVRRHDPQFAGGLPDLWDHAFEVPPRDYALWNEVLREAGLRGIEEVA